MASMGSWWTKMQKRAHACSQCGSGSVHRSARKGMIENVLLRPVAISPYRCSNCDRRFLDVITRSPRRAF
jgi:DNA-directed RNA polymerase subunit RPC12/RpoP